ncbi:MAG: tellurite resistance TerB family protein [Albidovulum sp.]|nr:tellurite resistance TerB family protein [Albidovulum sp.]MDE0303992.1 tellurite resistance TerB family protein [Albidovulum sp.]MDE0532499.1 tellurite resistance TerB family protein [Albidovulum sp.]
MNRTSSTFTAQDALLAIMVAVSASDENMKTAELVAIERIVNHFPAFADFDTDRIEWISRTVLDLLEDPEGLQALFGLVRDALPARLYETAYAMACDIAAADGRLDQDELSILLEVRHELDIDRLAAAALERGARARHMTL